MPTDQPLTLGVKTETRMTAVISNPANRNKNLGQSCPHSAEGGSSYCIYSKLKLNLGVIWYQFQNTIGANNVKVLYMKQLLECGLQLIVFCCTLWIHRNPRFRSSHSKHLDATYSKSSEKPSLCKLRTKSSFEFQPKI